MRLSLTAQQSRPRPGPALKAHVSPPPQMAQYFCSGVLRDQEQFRHYALNVPLYTHFTSPIRRFADVMVHRLLAAALGKAPHGGPPAQMGAQQPGHPAVAVQAPRTSPACQGKLH